MRRSQTFHCVGYALASNGRRRIFTAMNRLEIAQARHNAEKEGLKIASWIAQTKTGEKILGCDCFGFLLDVEVPSVKTVICPICKGDGHNGKFYCVVCKGSGITRPGRWYEKSWQSWQLEDMKSQK